MLTGWCTSQRQAVKSLQDPWRVQSGERSRTGTGPEAPGSCTSDCSVWRWCWC